MRQYLVADFRDVIALKFLLIGVCFAIAVSDVRGQEPLATEGPREIRVGIIGLDMVDASAFTRLLNRGEEPLHIPGARVVAAYPGGSADIPLSVKSLPIIRGKIEEIGGVEIVDSIPKLLGKVDAVLIESVDGRPHLEQARLVFGAGKRAFIEKPLAGSLDEAREIVRLSRESGVPFFSSSALRFYAGVRSLLDQSKVGKILGADAYSPALLEPHHPDLYWYAIHGVEMLYTVMGPGCESVTRIYTDNGELVVGVWKDGRIGTFRGLRKGPHDYGLRVVGEQGVFTAQPLDATYHASALKEIVEFFRTGQPPVSGEETLEMFEFMTAAQLSRDRDGQRVYLRELRREP